MTVLAGYRRRRPWRFWRHIAIAVCPTCGYLAHQLRQHRPEARGAGAVLLMDQAAAGRLEFDLGVSLILGRDAGIVKEAADRGTAVARAFGRF